MDTSPIMPQFLALMYLHAGILEMARKLPPAIELSPTMSIVILCRTFEPNPAWKQQRG